jgi:isocitrate dehydrogenase
MLAKTLDAATGKLLDNNKGPSPRPASSTTAAASSTWRCTGRRRWPRRPRTQALAARFAPLAKQLAAGEQKIVDELAAVQGKPADIGGYYLPDFAKLDQVMRPSATLNAVLAASIWGSRSR